MENLWKILAGAMISVVLATTLRGNSKEFASIFTIAASIVLITSGITIFRTALKYTQSLQDLADMEGALLKPVLNVCGIGLATHLCASFCQEAGEGTIGKIVSLCGNVAAVCVSIPLLDAVQSMIREFLR